MAKNKSNVNEILATIIIGVLVLYLIPVIMFYIDPLGAIGAMGLLMRNVMMTVLYLLIFPFAILAELLNMSLQPVPDSIYLFDDLKILFFFFLEFIVITLRPSRIK